METRLIDKQAVLAKVQVTYSAEEVDQAFDRILRQLSRRVRIPGFRPGKAPRGVLIRQIGEHALQHEVRDELVDDGYPKALKEHELVPAGARVDAGHPHQGQEFAFEIEVDLFPEVELPDLDEIVIDSEARAVTDEDVQATVERLRNENATQVPVDRAAEAGDVVLVETLGEGDEGTGSTMPIDLDAVDPDFGDQLLGKAAGDEVELVLSAGRAAEEDAEEDAGDDAGGAEAEAADAEGGDAGDAEGGDAADERPTLRVRIVDVKSKDKPAADDEFAATLGFGSWDEVLTRIRATLEEQVRQEAYEAQRDEFVEKLLAETSVELPRGLVDRRKQNLLENLASDLKERGTDLQAYVADLEEKGTREEFDAELQEAAETGVKRDLVLERLMESRGTVVSDEEYRDALAYLAAREGTDPASLRRERGDDWLRNYRFLLTRDKALRDVIREKTGDAPMTRAEAEAARAARAAVQEAMEEGAGDGADGGAAEGAEPDRAAAGEG